MQRHGIIGIDGVEAFQTSTAGSAKRLATTQSTAGKAAVRTEDRTPQATKEPEKDRTSDDQAGHIRDMTSRERNGEPQLLEEAVIRL